MNRSRRDERNVHQKLLVGVRGKLWLGIQALVPRLLAYFAPHPRNRLVQSVDGAEINLLVYVVLQRRSDIIRVVVSTVVMAVTMTVAVARVFIVTMRHCRGSSAVDGGNLQY